VPKFVDEKFVPEVGDFATDAANPDGRVLVITDEDDEFFHGVWHNGNEQEDYGMIRRSDAQYSHDGPTPTPYTDFD